MARWEYDLKTMGKNLRDYINEGNSSKESLIRNLQTCE